MRTAAERSLAASAGGHTVVARGYASGVQRAVTVCRTCRQFASTTDHLCPPPKWSALSVLRTRTVDSPSGCWLWSGPCTSRNGYGIVRSGQTRSAHRLAWELAHGPIPMGLSVCHHCDTPRCVNPAHLFLGTQQDNLADMRAKGRQVRGERTHSHKLTAADVLEIRRCLSAGTMSSPEIADRFGISRLHVNAIRRRDVWGWLA